MPDKCTTLMLGVGGMGMAPLALAMHDDGYDLYGYDDHLIPAIALRLQGKGITILDTAELPETVKQVVMSSAIPAQHLLLEAARDKGIPVLRRGEMLALLAQEKKLVAVTGSHGKTTTAAMLVWALQQQGMRFDYVLGAFMAGEMPAGRGGSGGEWLIAEVDESDGTIDLFAPQVSIILNLDLDHTQRYPTKEAYKDTFMQLASRTQQVVISPLSVAIELNDSETSADWLTYGADGVYRSELTQADLEGLHIALEGRFAAQTVRVEARGAFNAANAAAALTATDVLCGGVRRSCLEAFPGVERRQQCLYRSAELDVWEDYAHHPQEIRAMLSFLKKTYPQRHSAVVFQPHRYTRTAYYRDELAVALQQCDALYLCEVYAASEEPLAGGRVEDLAARFPPGFPLQVFSAEEAEAGRLPLRLDTASVVLFLGAGETDRWARSWLKAQSSTEEDTADEVNIPRSEFRDTQWWESLKGQVSQETVLRVDEPLARKSTLGVGGPARYYAEPDSTEDLQILWRQARKAGIPIFPLGRGSNIIVADEGFPGLVIRFSQPYWRTVSITDDGLIETGAGARLKQICAAAMQAGLSGFEFLEGIPGTVGGALRMNAGAMGGWMFDVVEAVEVLNADGSVIWQPLEAFSPQYRGTPELKEALALRARLKAPGRENTDSIRLRIDTYADKRKNSQPREPSAGCIFKNPEGDYAGRLIDAHGLKGLRVGQAEVSAVHGNFIINRGGASTTEIIELVRLIRQRVRDASGIELQPEVLLVGQKWEDVL